ncbi:MAG: glycosyl transferase family 1, partial [Chloroflexi bacterium]|nr:glycosyl transferase family 1 [Chloroflexota bacterium]
EVEVAEELTHYCFPATQTLVYTVGKELIEHNLLPSFISRSTHRFSGEQNSGSRVNPINWAHAVLDWFDRPNEDPARVAAKETFVNVTLKARRL